MAKLVDAWLSNEILSCKLITNQIVKLLDNRKVEDNV